VQQVKQPSNFKGNEMNHSELVKHIAEKTSQTQTAVKAVLDELATTIQTTSEVTLQGVAKFSTTVREARTGRNPATGEPMQLKAKRVPVIKALKPLKDAVAKAAE
jgi:DNA-binding protein HU-beta